jgi:uncharacterized protein (TIGR02679 family)
MGVPARPTDEAEVPLPERLAGPALTGLWARCWKAMARAGPDGWRTVTIRVPLEEAAQRHAVAGLLGRRLPPGTAAASVGLDALDAVVRRPADGWDLVRVVEATGGPLPDRARAARAQDTAIGEARDAARAILAAHGWAEAWLEELGGGMLARLHGRGELELVVTSARILDRLPADGMPLPALATDATGDTKALAGTTLEGLVLRGLALSAGQARPRTAAERRTLWESAGVVPDDLASQVLVLNLPVAPDGGGLGDWLHDAAVRGWPFRATLHLLDRSPLRVRSPRVVSVCENPAVLRAAAERLGSGAAPLVCTEGRPSVACWRLLATLREGGCELRYHGDFDWPGLQIAAAVLAEPGTTPWRMGADDYLAALDESAAGGSTTDPERARLRGTATESPWDPGLATAMRQRGAVVYEEDVIDLLVDDLRTAPPPDSTG